MALKVSDIAKRSGVSPDAVRFYEKEGLVPPPPRTTSGYRVYDDSTVERIRFIKGAQSMGLRLAEIRELLDIQDKGACPCGHTKTIVDRRMAELDAEIERLSILRAELASMAELDCPATTDGELWACEVEFVKRGGES